jgi:superfamily II DNA/RNA helicase
MSPKAPSVSPRRSSAASPSSSKPSAVSQKLPAKKVVTPAKKVVTPAKKVVTPAKKVVTPAKKVVTPAKKVVTPAKKKVVTPAKKVVTPAKKVVTPAKKKVVTPAKKTVTKPVVQAKAKVAAPPKPTTTRKAVAVQPALPKPVLAQAPVRKSSAPKVLAPVPPTKAPAPKSVAPKAPKVVAPKPLTVQTGQTDRPVVLAGPEAKPVVASSFADLGIPSDLLDALTQHGLLAPFDVQALTIPDGLAGRDVCGQAKTGSGKTLAFGIPLVCRVVSPVKPKCPSGLVLVPTRELAAQVERELIWLAKPRKLKVVSIYGGVSMEAQKDGLNGGAEIVVATPGRLIDLLGRGDIDLSHVTFLVLDEADRMCDMGFMPNVEWLLRKMPKQRQTLLFSATLGSDVNSLIRHELTNPVRHTVESDTSTVELSVHHFLQVHQMDRGKVIATILKANDRGIVFLNTKRACDRMAEDLKELGISARAIHGDLSQEQRNRALKQFIEGKIGTLVATDVAARGLHIDGVDVVIQADIPIDHKTYLHRAGRTARAGAAGVVVTLSAWNQQMEVTRLQKRLGMKTALVELFSNDKRLNDLENWVPGTV